MFDDLDLGGNEMFCEPAEGFNILGQSKIHCLYVGANGTKGPAFT